VGGMSAGRAGYDAMVALEQDAARYRWLRELTQDSADVMMQWGAGLGHDPAWLDAAIDDAMDPRYTITPAGREHLDGKAGGE